MKTIRNDRGLMGIFRAWTKEKKQEMRLLILGLDNAGKTSIIKSLCNEDLTAITPTKGFNIKSVTFDKIKLNVWDIGGQKALREQWSNYFPNTDALIYVVDSADIKRVKQAGRQLEELLIEKDLSGVPLLIFANKQDLAQALDPQQIMTELKVGDIKTRKWTITACSAKTTEGIQEGMAWLMEVAKK